MLNNDFTGHVYQETDVTNIIYSGNIYTENKIFVYQYIARSSYQEIWQNTYNNSIFR